jgi:hypothetical protein
MGTPDQPAQEQRQFSRIAFDAAARLNSESASWESRVIDVSLKGALLEQPAGWTGSIGDRYTLTLPLADDVAILMEVAVAHIEDGRVGFHCEHIDVDSITHLRRLVELNLGDPALLERELAHLDESP